MKKYFILNNKQYIIASIIFVVAGILAGYIYYITVGCSTNGCAITSNPFISSLWGGLIGYLLSGVVFKKKKPTDNKE